MAQRIIVETDAAWHERLRKIFPDCQVLEQREGVFLIVVPHDWLDVEQAERYVERKLNDAGIVGMEAIVWPWEEWPLKDD